MNLEKLKQKRTACKGWVTRLTDTLNTLCEDKTVNSELIKDNIDELDKKLKNLDSVQGDIEELLSDMDLTSDVDEAYNFIQRARQVRVKAQALVTAQPKKRDELVAETVGAKLPKIELPKFGGNVLEWTSFFEQYNAIVHSNPSVKTNIAKFSYLISLLYGEALGCISGLL